MSSSSSSPSSQTPRRPSPPLQQRRQALNVHSPASSDADTSLQIRVVPYSPPRLSVDASGSASLSSRSGSYMLDRQHGSYGNSDDQDPFTDSKMSPEDALSPTVRQGPGRRGSEIRLRPSGVSDVQARHTPNIELLASSPNHSIVSRNDSSSTVNASPAASPAIARPSSATSSIGSSASRVSRRNRVITLNGKGTFSLAPLSGSLSSRTDSLQTQDSSFNTTTGLYSRVSSAFLGDDRPASPITTLGERSRQVSQTSFGSTDTATAANWNSRLVGGLSKSTDAPVRRRQDYAEPSSRFITPQSSNEPLLPSRQSNAETGSEPTLRPKFSFQSSEVSSAASTISERTNYKVYGQSSPAPAGGSPSNAFDSSPRPGSGYSDADVNVHVLGQSSPVTRSGTVIENSSPPSAQSSNNYEVFGQSSPVVAVRSRIPPSFLSSPGSANWRVHTDSSVEENSLYDLSPSATGGSEANYIVHQSSPSKSSVATRARPQYSRESLVIPPLQPGRKSSFDSFSLVTKRSRDSFRSGSFSSLHSIITQEAARVLFAGPAAVYIPAAVRKPNNGVLPVLRSGQSSSAPMLASHPHQWSSQLSTVPSESEPSSRSLSPLEDAARRTSDNIDQRVRSLSGSLSISKDSSSPSASQTPAADPIERPQAAQMYMANREANASNPMLIRDYDEDGDGLAELQTLSHKGSRGRLSMVLNHQSSDRNLRSRASSLASVQSVNLKHTLPAWAQVYYGSGERRFVITHPSTDSMYSLYQEGQRNNSRHGRSPTHERFLSVFGVSRRRDSEPLAQVADNLAPGQPIADDRDDISQGSHPVMQVARHIRKQTSSLWSPHLGYDRRATGFSMWEPPAASWSSETGASNRRNRQVVMFIVGFVFPFAWMAASVLPLPTRPTYEMAERDETTDSQDPEQATTRRRLTPEMAYYMNARWWRNLNRFMSIVGLLVIGAIFALAVIGAKQGWSS